MFGVPLSYLQLCAALKIARGALIPGKRMTVSKNKKNNSGLGPCVKFPKEKGGNFLPKTNASDFFLVKDKPFTKFLYAFLQEKIFPRAVEKEY